jgi:hypothetical protein
MKIQKNDMVWLANLHPGDIIYVNCGRGTNYQLVERKVKKITKTQIVLTNDTRFRKRDGTCLESDLFSHIILIEPTEENCKKYEHQMYEQSLRDTLYRANKYRKNIPISLGKTIIDSMKMFLESIN